MRAKVNRVLIYCAGLLILALGITLGTKAGLGVSPIISVAFIVSENTGVDLGNATFVLYSAFVAGEFLLRGRNSRWYDILQLPLSLVFTRFLNIYGHFITYDSANHGLFENLLILALGIVDRRGNLLDAPLRQPDVDLPEQLLLVPAGDVRHRQVNAGEVGAGL